MWNLNQHGMVFRDERPSPQELCQWFAGYGNQERRSSPYEPEEKPVERLEIRSSPPQPEESRTSSGDIEEYRKHRMKPEMPADIRAKAHRG